MFDQMIQEVAQRFGLGDKAGPLVHSVVGMMTDERSGGLQGFLSAFDEGGMGSAVRSWVGGSASEPIDASQVESALGGGVVADLARKFGLDRGMVGGALAFLIPRIVDLLTPDGNVPSNASLMSKLGGFLGGAGAAAGKAGDAMRGVAGGAQRMAGEAVDEVGSAARKSGGMLRWLLLLLILALVLWWLAKSCQPQSADGGIGEGTETTEMMEGQDASGVDGDTAHEVDAGRAGE